MRAIKSNWLLLAAVITYASCMKSGSASSKGSGKSDSTTSGGTGTANTNGCLLTDMVSEGFDYLYSYNPDKSVSGIAVQQQFSYPWTATYSYSGDTTVMVQKNGNVPGKYTVTMTKNAQGLVKSLFYEDFDASGNPTTWTNFDFQYSGQNPSLCTETVDGLNYVAFFYYTYTNGNLTSIYAGQGTTMPLYPHAMSFTYDQNTPVVLGDVFWQNAKVNSWGGYYMWGIYPALYPVQNKNIAIAQIYTDSLVHQTSVDYTFDSNKNITLSKATTATYGGDSVAFHYSCSN